MNKPNTTDHDHDTDCPIVEFHGTPDFDTWLIKSAVGVHIAMTSCPHAHKEVGADDSDFTPTHKITTEHDSFLVQFEEFENAGGPAYTKEEWDGGDPADYERNHHGVWTLLGQPFRGTVEEV